jgi:hypothetical protein
MHPDEGYIKFQTLFERYSNNTEKLNEADTRAKIIDILIKDCLGWDESCLRRENHVNVGYIDYKLMFNDIYMLIIEAKREGDYFEIPITMNSRMYKISGSISTVNNLIKAMKQVRSYCIDDIGCKYAVVCNGHQLVLFPTITINKSWTDAYCIVFNSLDDIKANFNIFWNILSFENVVQGSLVNYVEKGKRDLTFNKFISEIHNPDQCWARNELYTFIRPLSDLIFSELIDETLIDILKKCYVFDRSNKPTDEMESYFSDKMPHFADKYKIKEIIEREIKAGSFQKEFYLKSHTKASGSIIVLLGGIGSGKTTFLHRFFKIIISDHENILWFYINFNKSPFEVSEIEKFIFHEMLEQWASKYDQKLCDVLESVGFSASILNPKDYFSKLFTLLSNFKFSVTIILDNIDRHDIKFQEKTFILANHLTEALKTVTIVALREETFLTSTRLGVFDAYHIPKFHIAAPNFLSMILKRINFTINYLSNISGETHRKILPEKSRQDLIKYFTIIGNSLHRENAQSRKIVHFVDSISVGNMREALRMFNNFIVSGNTNIKEIFQKHDQSGSYQLS